MDTKHYPENTEQVADRPLARPAVDIFENQDELLLVVDMPGVDARDVSVDVDKDVLTIIGKRNWSPGNGARLLFGEPEAFDFKRVFTLPSSIDADKIMADLRGGVLEVHLPRHEKTKARRIAINAG